MKSVSEFREERMTAAMRDLRDGLAKVGLRLMRGDGYRGNGNYTPAKLDDCLSRHVVLNDNDQVVAAVDMNRGNSWYSNFHGWQVRLPTYEPRGSYHTRAHRRDPTDYHHWGFANIKSTASVVTKIKAAEGSLPTDLDVKIGELQRELDTLRIDRRRAEEGWRDAFKSTNVTEEIYGLLDALRHNGQHISVKLKNAMDDYDRSRRRYQKASKEIDAVWARITELQQQKGE